VSNGKREEGSKEGSKEGTGKKSWQEIIRQEVGRQEERWTGWLCKDVGEIAPVSWSSSGKD
jgi:hypothetical protein